MRSKNTKHYQKIIYFIIVEEIVLYNPKKLEAKNKISKKLKVLEINLFRKSTKVLTNY